MNTLQAIWRRIHFLIKKEMLAVLKDPKSRAVLFFPVIMQSLIYGYVANYNLDYVPYAVIDQSHSSASTELMAHIDGTGIFERTRTLQSSNQIADAIDSGDALLVINIAPDFAESLAKGRSGNVQIILDGRNSTTAGIASGYISSIVASYNQKLSGSTPPLVVQSVSWYNPNLITRWMFIPSLIPMLALIQVLLLAGLSVARERENGTFDQLLVTPLSPREILIGKAVPSIVIGLIQVTFILLIAIFWFKIPMAGSLFTLYLTVFIFLISCVGVGLSISAVSNNMQQVMVYCFILMMPMVLLSGFSTPVSNMPTFMQYATYVNPLRFAIESIRRIYLEGAGLATIAHNFIPMLIVAAITLPIAGWLFRNKLS